MKKFTCKNGETVQIVIDDWADFETTVVGPNGENIGKFSFRRDDEFGDFLKLTWMYLDQSDTRWKQQGIGREILKCVKEESGLSITASANDGHRQEDGSHLTGDAPAFVAKMREESIIEEKPV